MSSGVGVSVKELAVQVLAATGVKAPLATDPALARAGGRAGAGRATTPDSVTPRGGHRTRHAADLIDDLVDVLGRHARAHTGVTAAPHAR